MKNLFVKALKNKAVPCMAVWLCFMLFNLSTAQAQSPENGEAAERQTEIKPLQIGDTIPEKLWNLPLQVVNHPEGKELITLNDYRDKKLIILDFWATYCSPCIKSITKLDSVEQVFGDQMVVMPILVYDRPENALPFMGKKGWKQPSVVNDTLWNKTILSRYLTGFGNAWIMDGKLVAVPRPDNLTFTNIRRALLGTFPELQNLEQSF